MNAPFDGQASHRVYRCKSQHGGGQGRRGEMGPSQVGLGDVQDGIPGIKALLDEGVEVLFESQLGKDSSQFRHAARRRVQADTAREAVVFRRTDEVAAHTLSA